MEYGTAYSVGIIVGFLIVIVIVAVIYKIFNKITGTKCGRGHYDERQQLARGVAYKAGFFTMIFCMVGICVLQSWIKDYSILTFSGIWVGICISILVFAVICIWKDAYMSLVERPKQIILAFLVIGVLNIVTGIIEIEKQPIIVDGALSTTVINFASGILILVVALVFISKLIYDRCHAEMEE